MNRTLIFSCMICVALSSCGKPAAPVSYDRARFAGPVAEYSRSRVAVSGEAEIGRCDVLDDTRFTVLSQGSPSFRQGDVVRVTYGTRFGGKELVPVAIFAYGTGDLASFRVDPKDAARFFFAKVNGLTDDGKILLAGQDGKVRALDLGSVPDVSSSSNVRPEKAASGATAYLDCRRPVGGGDWEAESVTIVEPFHRDPVEVKTPAKSGSAKVR